MPFYVSPEQVMKDRADYARKGIARGRSVVVAQCAQGIVFVAENPSRALHKVSEIYDRIAFAAVGRYNEFENLRIAGVRLADLKGYSYDRRDVTGRTLANAYAQTLGAIFSGGEKPYEVEVVVAELGADSAGDQVYRLTYDGSVADERGWAVMGGAAEAVATVMGERYVPGSDLAATLQAAVGALARGGAPDGDTGRTLPAEALEVALLDRERTQQRKFRRITGTALTSLLTPPPGPGDPGDGRRDTGGTAGPDAPLDPDSMPPLDGDLPAGSDTTTGSASATIV